MLDAVYHFQEAGERSGFVRGDWLPESEIQSSQFTHACVRAYVCPHAQHPLFCTSLAGCTSKCLQHSDTVHALIPSAGAVRAALAVPCSAYVNCQLAWLVCIRIELLFLSLERCCTKAVFGTHDAHVYQRRKRYQIKLIPHIQSADAMKLAQDLLAGRSKVCTRIL